MKGNSVSNMVVTKTKWLVQTAHVHWCMEEFICLELEEKNLNIFSRLEHILIHDRQVSWELDIVYYALSDKFPEHWMVFMMCSVTSFLSTGWCLWCTEWQVSWALDGVYDVLSDNFPEHWMVFVVHWVTSFLSTGWCLLMHSVTVFLSTGQCLWCAQW